MAVSPETIMQRVKSRTMPSVPLEFQDPQQSVRILGFWLFLATDMLLFGCLFSMYLVVRTHTDGGPTAHDLFDMTGFGAETPDPLDQQLHRRPGHPGHAPGQAPCAGRVAAGDRPARPELRRPRSA